MTHPDFEDFVRDNWIYTGNFSDSCAHFTEAVQTWNRLGNIQKRKRRVLARLNLQSALAGQRATSGVGLRQDIVAQFVAKLLSVAGAWRGE